MSVGVIKLNLKGTLSGRIKEKGKETGTIPKPKDTTLMRNMNQMPCVQFIINK